MGTGWKIEEQDKCSLLLTEIDLNKMSFETCLKEGESWITGEEKLRRHAKAKHVLADAKIGQILFEEKDQKILEYLYKKYGYSHFELPGTILRSPDNRCYTLYLHKSLDRWDLDYDHFECGRNADFPSLVMETREQNL